MQSEEQLNEKNKSEVQNEKKQNDKDNVIDLARNHKHSEEKLENLEKLHVDVSPGKKEANDRQEGNKEEVRRAQESIGSLNALQENGVRGGEEQVDKHISENEGESHKKQEMEGNVTDLSRNICHIEENLDQTEQLEASSQQGEQNVKKESFYTFSECEGENENNPEVRKEVCSWPQNKFQSIKNITILENVSENEGQRYEEQEYNITILSRNKMQDQEKQWNTTTLDHNGHIEEQQTIKTNYEEKTNQNREKSNTFSEMNTVVADDRIPGQNDPTSSSIR